MAIERKKPSIEREKKTITREKKSLARSGVKLKKRQRTDPDFDSVFDDGNDNPFAGVEMTGDLQEDADTNMSEALRQIIEKKKASQERFRVAVDPEFFFCMVFQSRAQKDEFLKAAGWYELGDKYLNGLEVAQKMGIEIEVIPIEPLTLRGKVKRYKPEDTL